MDANEPQLFDYGKGIYTGQTGMCYRTEEQIESGVPYEDGRTVLFSLAQGKSAGTEQNIWAGWAHNMAMPVDLYLANDGKTVIREPIKEMESLYDETLYSYNGDPLNVAQMNEQISQLRGDALEIKAHVNLNPTSENYNSGLYVRYNKNVVNDKTERTAITLSNNGAYVDRLLSTVTTTVDRSDTNTYTTSGNEFDLTILLDRSLLEVYINNEITLTTRIYPKYGDSDYLSFFDNSGNLTISSLSIKSMKSAYFDEVTPAYYGNSSNLGD